MSSRCNEEVLTFHSGGGVKLAASVFHPPTAGGSCPGIVLCQGFGGTRAETSRQMAIALAQAGLRVFTWDYRGFGDSEGLRGRVVPFEQIEDAVTAVEYFRAREDVDAGRVAIYGNSMGGGIVSGALLRLDGIRCAIVTVPGLAGSRRMDAHAERKRQLLARAREALVDKARGGPIAMADRSELVNDDPCYQDRFGQGDHPIAMESFLHISRGYDPIDWAPRIRTPFFIIAVAADRIAPLEDIQRFYQALDCEKDLHVFRTGDHMSVYGELLEPTVDLTLKWCRRHLPLS